MWACTRAHEHAWNACKVKGAGVWVGFKSKHSRDGWLPWPIGALSVVNAGRLERGALVKPGIPLCPQQASPHLEESPQTYIQNHQSQLDCGPVAWQVSEKALGKSDSNKGFVLALHYSPWNLQPQAQKLQSLPKNYPHHPKSPHLYQYSWEGNRGTQGGQAAPEAFQLRNRTSQHTLSLPCIAGEP